MASRSDLILSVASVILDDMVSLMKACRDAMSKPVEVGDVSSLGTFGTVGSAGVSATRLVGDEELRVTVGSERRILVFLEESVTLLKESCKDDEESSNLWL